MRRPPAPPGRACGLARLGRRGACLVIVTASPELIVRRPSRDGWAPTGCSARAWRSTPRPHHRPLSTAQTAAGAEKVVRLKAAFGEDVRLAAAYGDTDGDREMLAIAEGAAIGCSPGKP